MDYLAESSTNDTDSNESDLETSISSDSYYSFDTDSCEYTVDSSSSSSSSSSDSSPSLSESTRLSDTNDTNDSTPTQSYNLTEINFDDVNNQDDENEYEQRSVRRVRKRFRLFSSSDSDEEIEPVIKRPKTKLNETSSSDNEEIEIDCPICLDSIKELKKNKKKIMSTFCGHILCNKCCDLIFGGKKASECPKCRTRLKRNQVHFLFI